MTEPRNSALPDAAPPVWARIVAAASIVVGGACGGLIGWSVVALQCSGDNCGTTAALAGVGGAIAGAIGVAVVAVLTLRAMAEWKAIENRDRARRARGLS